MAAAAVAAAGLTPIGGHNSAYAAGPQGSVPAGLPGHVMLGLESSPSDLGWMTSSGARWDARYQYLVGGVNSGHGWSTWNSPSGAFALWYMQASGNAGILPVFSYYQMLQSLPASGSTEAQKDYSNLNNASTMYSYFADFKLLMDQASTYGKPVIVQVEPDLWGYMEQMAGSCGRASCVSAAVASSGYSAAAAYPNTVQGFAEALLHLRDLYAPNVIMAIHASCWGSKFDVCNHPTSLSDTAAKATQDGNFLASAGISGNQGGTSTWDLIFTDTSDRDAGYYQNVLGDSSHWWDPTDSALPDFANFRTWVAGVNAAAGRRIVLWQTPLGNQYFQTDNNTAGHYQDNRAQYFLGDGPSYSHLQNFASAGVVGVLFGSGMSGQTTYTDANGDGVTNPAPVYSFQCNACNAHVSTVSDDDGGYLRQFGGAYLNSGGVSLSGGTSPAPAPSAAVTVSAASGLTTWTTPGWTANLSAIVTSTSAISGAVIDFEVYNASGARVGQTFVSGYNLPAGSPQTITRPWVVPATLPAGTYTFKVGVFASGWSSLYAWNNGVASIWVS